MAIQDSDPERRNLMVTSIAFIAYFYAGGSFLDSNVRLQVINANFSKPEVLTWMAWISFAWFIYRYWLTHKGKFYSNFFSEFSKFKDKEYIKKYVAKHIGDELVTSQHQNEGYVFGYIRWKAYCVTLESTYGKDIQRDEQGKITSYTVVELENSKGEIKMTSLQGWFLAIRALFECIYKNPSFSDYIVPYILVVIAMVGVFIG